MFSWALAPGSLIDCQQPEMRRSFLPLTNKTVYLPQTSNLLIWKINQHKSPGEHLQASERMIPTARRHGQLQLSVAAGEQTVSLS